MKETITYFETPGKANTDEALRIARERAEKSGIETVIMSSTSGYAASRSLEIFEGSPIKLIATTYGKRFSSEVQERFEAAGHTVFFSDNWSYDHPKEAWELLRRFSEGMKVCVQDVLMATEAGLLEEGEEVVSLGGTGNIGYPPGGGVDTAIVMEAVKGEGFFKLDLPPGESKLVGRKIKEFLCKPR